MKPPPDLMRKWNGILARQGLDAIRPSKPNRAEREAQEMSGKFGVPNWGSVYRRGTSKRRRPH